MKYKTIIQLEAAQDFKEAKLWYKRTKVNGLTLTLSGTTMYALHIPKNSLTLFIFLLIMTSSLLLLSFTAAEILK